MKKVICIVLLQFLWPDAKAQPSKFIDEHYQLALMVEAKTGVTREWLLTHAAIETGWKTPQGNNYFGVKGKGIRSKTVEYYTHIPKHVEVISKTKVGNKWRCVIWASFKTYPTALDSWLEYANILQRKVGFGCTSNEIAESLHLTKYATNPKQYVLYKKVLIMVKANLWDRENCKRTEE